MKYLLIALVLLSSSSSACVVDPRTRTAIDPEWYYEKADLVFLGKIISFDDLLEWKQIVSSSIDKTFKGPELNSVTITNMLNSSCSSAFTGKGSSYYVFAKLDTGSGNYVIERHATFVPVKIAEAHDMNLDTLITRHSNGAAQQQAAP